MANKKEKKYVIDNKELMEEWDWEKNNAGRWLRSDNQFDFRNNRRRFGRLGIRSVRNCGFRHNRQPDYGYSRSDSGIMDCFFVQQIIKTISGFYGFRGLDQ